MVGGLLLQGRQALPRPPQGCGRERVERYLCYRMRRMRTGRHVTRTRRTLAYGTALGPGCTHNDIPLGELHLVRVLRAFVDYYNAERCNSHWMWTHRCHADDGREVMRRYPR